MIAAASAVPRAGMADLHSHMLPGVDDGAKDLDQAINMARQAVADGIAVSILTPHHLNGVYRNGAEEIRDRCSAFDAALKERGIHLVVRPGAECHLVPELPAALAAGSAMTLADRGKVILVELPVHTVPRGATEILEEILGLGLQPIIAHPERNTELARQPARLAEWNEMGCLGQVTAQSCTGRFGAAVQAAAREMVRLGLIHFIASDAHRDQRRIPELVPGRLAVERWTSPEVGELLTETFPNAVVEGRPVEAQRLVAALSSRRPYWVRWFGMGRSSGFPGANGANTL
jgi:protein-tyrosine phosphatase